MGNLVQEEALCARCGGQRSKDYWSGYRDHDEDDGDVGDLGVLLKGKDFDEKPVRRAVKALGREGRGRL